MGDLEMSLDEIIKKKIKKNDLNRNRNNPRNMKKSIRRISDPSNRVTKKAPLNAKLRTAANVNVRRKGGPANVVDARNKIIQKQRLKMTDAREKLGQIAKKTDARLRLLKMRDQRNGGMGTVIRPVSGMRSAQMRVLPEKSILQRTVQPRINNAILYDDEIMDFASDAPYLNRSSIILNGINYTLRGGRPDPSLLYRTVENDRLNEQIKMNMDIDDYDDDDSDLGYGINTSNRGQNIRVSTPSWNLGTTPIVITKKIKPQEPVGILKRMPVGQTVKIIKESSPLAKPKGPARTLSERFCQGGNQLSQKITLLKAKLEASQNNGKLNQAETQGPIGTRIVVSNLVPSVTHEDVKELFEDIGELISSKVVRPGTAEVVYKLHKDAVRAVDVYHNRQLDGQPMKCLLVNNRSAAAVASKSLKGGDKKMGRSVVEVDLTAFRKALHKKSTP